MVQISIHDVCFLEAFLPKITFGQSAALATKSKVVQTHWWSSSRIPPSRKCPCSPSRLRKCPLLYTDGFFKNSGVITRCAASYVLYSFLGTVVGGRRGVEIGPAGGGTYILATGGGRTLDFRRGEGGGKSSKSHQNGPKNGTFLAKKFFHILGGFLGKS